MNHQNVNLLKKYWQYRQQRLRYGILLTIALFVLTICSVVFEIEKNQRLAIYAAAVKQIAAQTADKPITKELEEENQRLHFWQTIREQAGHNTSLADKLPVVLNAPAEGIRVEKLEYVHPGHFTIHGQAQSVNAYLSYYRLLSEERQFASVALVQADRVGDPSAAEGIYQFVIQAELSPQQE